MTKAERCTQNPERFHILRVDLKEIVLRSSMRAMKIFTVLLALILVRVAVAQEENVFGYRDVVQKAEALSKQPFVIQNQELSPDLAEPGLRPLSQDPLSAGAICVAGFSLSARFFPPRLLFQAPSVFRGNRERSSS